MISFREGFLISIAFLFGASILPLVSLAWRMWFGLHLDPGFLWLQRVLVLTVIGLVILFAAVLVRRRLTRRMLIVVPIVASLLMFVLEAISLIAILSSVATLNSHVWPTVLGRFIGVLIAWPLPFLLAWLVAWMVARRFPYLDGKKDADVF